MDRPIEDSTDRCPEPLPRPGAGGGGGDGPSRGPEPSRPPRSAPPLLRSALIFYAVMLAAAGLWATLAGESLFFASARWELRGADPARDLAAGVLAAAIVILVTQQLTLHTRRGAELARALGALLGGLSVAQCALLAAASGIAEEAFFRGALQPRVGLVAASLLFGLAHFAPRRELLPWTFFSVAAGFLLGALFAATGNLLAPVAAHALINGVNLRILSVRHA